MHVSLQRRLADQPRLSRWRLQWPWAL